jgi:hypothetical protein
MLRLSKHFEAFFSSVLDLEPVPQLFVASR